MKGKTEVAQKRKKTTAKMNSSAETRAKRLTKKEVELFKEVLLLKRREILGDVNEMKDEALKKSRLDATGDLSSMPIHMADLGTDNYEQEFALELMDSERKMIRQIDEALMRIEEGGYGICEGTNKPIKKARLEAKPWAKYCVSFATKLEQGLVEETEEYEQEA